MINKEQPSQDNQEPQPVFQLEEPKGKWRYRKDLAPDEVWLYTPEPYVDQGITWPEEQYRMRMGIKFEQIPFKEGENS